MARIRSVHPGLFTDEAFVSCSPLARLLTIGLWTEADDQGVFEWKPVTLKMRVLPVDNADVDGLLEELVLLNMVRSYEHDGRKYGAIRNFRKYQRPKKPNSIHFIPSEFRTYVGLSGEGSEPELVKDNPLPKKGEISPQMEDGGGRMDSVPNGTGGKPPAVGEEFPDQRKQVFDMALPTLKAQGHDERNARSVIGRWRKLSGGDDSALVGLLAEAGRVRPANLVEWMGRCLSAKQPRQFKTRTQVDTEEFLAEFGADDGIG